MSRTNASASQTQSKPFRPLGDQRSTYISVVSGKKMTPRTATRAEGIAASKSAGRASQMKKTPRRGKKAPSMTRRQPIEISPQLTGHVARRPLEHAPGRARPTRSHRRASGSPLRWMVSTRPAPDRAGVGTRAISAVHDGADVRLLRRGVASA